MLKIVFANTTATVSVGPGNHVTVHEGEHWPANDPIVQAHPGLFTADARRGLRISRPLEEESDASEPEAPIEQATKAPGEKRTTRRA